MSCNLKKKVSFIRHSNGDNKDGDASNVIN